MKSLSTTLTRYHVEAMSSMIWLDLEPFSYSAPHSLVQSPNASSCNVVP